MAEESISGYTNNSDGQQRSAEKNKFDSFENLIKMSDLHSSAKRKEKPSSNYDDELDADETDEKTSFDPNKNVR